MDVLLWHGLNSIKLKYKIFVIAGESSGDHHAGNLLSELRKIHPDLDIKGWGGDGLRAAGTEILVPFEKANFMGFTEVVLNLFTILKLFKKTKQSILQFKPDLLLLVDYPGFNLRMAEWAHQNNIKVHYFIAPQVWAWKENRVKIIRRCVEKLYVILPFEKNYFKKHDIDASFYGHPQVELIKHFASSTGFRSNWNLDCRSIISILPGSRAQEIKKLLPIYLDALKDECKYQIAIAGLSRHKDLYRSIINKHNTKCHVVYDDMYSLLKHTKIAIVTSGTASLETALFQVPEIVCYKGGWISYWIAKQLVKVKFISLANLIADKLIVPELIQGDCNSKKILEELNQLKLNVVRKRMKYNLKLLQERLTGENCYKEIAGEMNHYLEKNKL